MKANHLGTRALLIRSVVLALLLQAFTMPALANDVVTLACDYGDFVVDLKNQTVNGNPATISAKTVRWQTTEQTTNYDWTRDFAIDRSTLFLSVVVAAYDRRMNGEYERPNQPAGTTCKIVPNAPTKF